jgi:hypothetical protein
MLPFILYFITAIFTSIHLLTLMSLWAYGAQVNSFELLALLVSFCLLIAAYLSLFRPYAAARLALLAALIMWSFYAPAIAHYVRGRLQKRSVLSAAAFQESVDPQLLVRSNYVQPAARCRTEETSSACR